MIAPARSDEKISVFISYSRDDLAFADQLEAALHLHKFGVVLDRKGISGGEKWEPRLSALIRDADTVAFVLSPTSAASPVCKWEVAEAARLGKRIVPVLCRPLAGVAAPEQLAERNYVFFYDEPKHPGSGFGTGLAALVQTLETDLSWLREGTRLLQRATEWDEGQRSDTRLLFGDSIAGAKGWLDRQPKNAPAPTSLLLDFIRASEEHETRRQSEDQRRLAEREELVQRAEAAQLEREDARRREAAQARRAVRIRTIGLAAALVLTAVSAIAGFNAWIGRQALAERTQDLEAANERLSAEMQLRVAPFGKRAYEIPEQWYKLATTNASSVAYIEFETGKEWITAGTGFVIRGSDLYPRWGSKPVFVTAGHVYHETKNSWREAQARIQFPALRGKGYIALGPPLWVTPDNNDPLRTTDATVFSVAEKLPFGVHPIAAISDIDVSEWPPAKFTNKGHAVDGSALDRVVPLIMLGAATNAIPDAPYDPKKPWTWRLTLSLANALGRDQRDNVAAGKFVATDSTTIGSSGSPIFDANDGKLVGILQYGTSDPEKVVEGLAYSGGTTIRAIKEAIVADARIAEESSRKMLQEGNIELAEMYLALAQAHNPAAAPSLALGRAEIHFKRGVDALGWRRDPEATEHLDRALQSNPKLASRIAAAKTDAYLGRAREAMGRGAIAEADALLQQAHRSSPGNAQSVSATWAKSLHSLGEFMLSKEQPDDATAEALFVRAVGLDAALTAKVNESWSASYLARGRRLLEQGRDAEARTEFDKAVQKTPTYAQRVNGEWASVFLERGRMLLQEGRVAEANSMLNRALTQDEDNAAAMRTTWARIMLDLVAMLLNEGKDSTAESATRSAIDNDPGLSGELDAAWTNIHVVRAGEKLAAGDEAEARAHFALARARIGDERRHAKIAEEWLRSERPRDALPDAEAYMASKSDPGGAAQLRGRIYLALDRFAEALADLDNAVRLGNTTAATLVARGLSYVRLGNRTAAVQNFQDALAKSPVDWNDDRARHQALDGLKSFGIQATLPSMSR